MTSIKDLQFLSSKEEKLNIRIAMSVKITHMKKFIERYRKDENQASLVQSRIKELAKLEKELVKLEGSENEKEKSKEKIT